MKITCGQCHNGELIPMTCKEYNYLGKFVIALPDYIIIDTCNNCGEKYINRATAKLINDFAWNDEETKTKLFCHIFSNREE